MTKLRGLSDSKRSSDTCLDTHRRVGNQAAYDSLDSAPSSAGGANNVPRDGAKGDDNWGIADAASCSSY
jgi:hypothetical protein